MCPSQNILTLLESGGVVRKKKLLCPWYIWNMTHNHWEWIFALLSHHTMATLGKFCPKIIWDKSQFYVTTNKKSEKIIGTFVMSTCKIDIKQKCLYFAWFFICWYLKLRFVSNILWTKIPKSSHCEQSPQLNDGNAVHLSRYLEINRFIGMTWTHSCSRKPYGRLNHYTPSPRITRFPLARCPLMRIMAYVRASGGIPR